MQKEDCALGMAHFGKNHGAAWRAMEPSVSLYNLLSVLDVEKMGLWV